MQLLPKTYPVTYLGADRDEGYFRDKREMLKDVEMPPTALRLNWNEVYDSASSEYSLSSRAELPNAAVRWSAQQNVLIACLELMVAWEPWENPVDVDDYLHIRAAPGERFWGP